MPARAIIIIIVIFTIITVVTMMCQISLKMSAGSAIFTTNSL